MILIKTAENSLNYMLVVNLKITNSLQPIMCRNLKSVTICHLTLVYYPYKRHFQKVIVFHCYESIEKQEHCDHFYKERGFFQHPDTCW